MKLTFKNIGRSGAILIESRAEFILSNEPFPFHVYSYPDRVSHDRIVVNPGESTPRISAKFGRHVSDEEAGQIRKGERFVTLLGHLIYEDFFEFEHTFKFILHSKMTSYGNITFYPAPGGLNRHTRKKKGTED